MSDFSDDGVVEPSTFEPNMDHKKKMGDRRWRTWQLQIGF